MCVAAMSMHRPPTKVLCACVGNWIWGSVCLCRKLDLRLPQGLSVIKLEGVRQMTGGCQKNSFQPGKQALPLAPYLLAFDQSSNRSAEGQWESLLPGAPVSQNIPSIGYLSDSSWHQYLCDYVSAPLRGARDAADRHYGALRRAGISGTCCAVPVVRGHWPVSNALDELQQRLGVALLNETCRGRQSHERES